MSKNCGDCSQYLLSESDLVIEITQSASVCSEIHISKNIVVEIDRKTLIIEFPENVTIEGDSGGGMNPEDVDAVICSIEAGGQINVNRVVSIAGDGRIVHADKDDDDLSCDVIGITKQSGAIGQMVEVVKFGSLTGATFGSISANLFLGNNGMITETPPTSGNWLSVGVQTAASEFFVNIGEPIRRN